MSSQVQQRPTIDIGELIGISRSGKALRKVISGYDPKLEIHEANGLRWLYTGGKSILSLLDPQHPVKLLLPNQIAMTMALLWCDRPGKLLNMGSGCGAIERLFNHYLPELKVTSLDADKALTGIAQQYFSMPKDWHVINKTAEVYLAESHEKYDILFFDLFTRDTHAPCFYDEAFYRHTAQHLTDKGVIAINLLPASEEDLFKVLLPLRHHFPSFLMYPIVAM